MLVAGTGGIAHAGFLPMGNYQIMDTATGGAMACLDDTNFSTSAWIRMQLYGCSGGLNQSWTILPIGVSFDDRYGYWQIKNRYSGNCLDVWFNRKTNGTPAIQYYCNTSDLAQQFMIENNCNGWFTCRNGLHIQTVQGGAILSGLCLDVPNRNPF